jgi:hypothetical protein
MCWPDDYQYLRLRRHNGCQDVPRPPDHASGPFMTYENRTWMSGLIVTRRDGAKACIYTPLPGTPTLDWDE